MKYIDADLLRKDIEFAKSVYDNPKRVVHGVADAFRQDGRAAMCDDILKKIDSLQQEQQEELNEETEKQKYDNRMKPIYDARESFESALAKAWKEYNDSGSRTVDGCEDNYVECAHAKGFREGYLFGIEKPMSQSEDVFKIWGTTEKEYLANSMDKVHLEMEIATYLKDWEDDEEIGLHLSTDNGCIPIELEDVRDLARHFAEWGAEHLRDSTKMIDKSLEEAAENSSTQYYKDAGYSPFPNVETAAHKSGFIAGAKWQKSQMLKDAVEGRIGAAGLHNSIFIKEPEWVESLDRLNKGDKVRIVIVKEDEK